MNYRFTPYFIVVYRTPTAGSIDIVALQTLQYSLIVLTKTLSITVVLQGLINQYASAPTQNIICTISYVITALIHKIHYVTSIYVAQFDLDYNLIEQVCDLAIY